jgi:pilus assembly protein CpaF
MTILKKGIRMLTDTVMPITTTPSSADINRLRKYLVNRVSPEIRNNPMYSAGDRSAVAQMIEAAYKQTGLSLSKEISDRVMSTAFSEIVGYGPIQPLLDDPDVSEIMVNGAKKVFIEKKGKVIKTGITFEDDEHVLSIIEKIILPLGRRIDADKPTVDARLPDGSRVNAVIPPVALDGPSITIRKFMKEKLTTENLISYGSMNQIVADFLRACVISRLSIVVSGGTGSGKTTLLNVLSGFIPEDERIVTIEDAAELQLQQDHVVRMETKNRNVDNSGEVTIRDLVRNSLRMRPDRIVIGECRGGEALDMLQAMNTGHDGSLTTIHANSPRDAISRLEILVMMAGMELPVKVIRQQIASAVDVIVQVARLKDGSRKIIAITEVAGMEGETVVLTDIFRFDQTGINEDGMVAGSIKPTGLRPIFDARLEKAGFKLKPETYSAEISSAMERVRKR